MNPRPLSAIESTISTPKACTTTSGVSGRTANGAATRKIVACIVASVAAPSSLPVTISMRETGEASTP